MKKFMKSASVVFLLGVVFMSTVQACFASNLVAMANFGRQVNNVMTQKVELRKEIAYLELENEFLADWLKKAWYPGLKLEWVDTPYSYQVDGEIVHDTQSIFVQEEHHNFDTEFAIADESRKLLKNAELTNNYAFQRFLLEEVWQNINHLSQSKEKHDIWRKSEMLGGVPFDDPRLAIPKAPNDDCLGMDISISTQTFHTYDHGKFLFSSLVTTGQDHKDYRTGPGRYTILSTNIPGHGLTEEKVKSGGTIDPENGNKRWKAYKPAKPDEKGLNRNIASLYSLRLDNFPGKHIHDSDAVYNAETGEGYNPYTPNYSYGWRTVLGFLTFGDNGSHGCPNTTLLTMKKLLPYVKRDYGKCDIVVNIHY